MAWLWLLPILLNHKLGMLSLSACITTMPLRADRPMKEPVCPHPSCTKLWGRYRTTPGMETCPQCLSGELETGRIKWMRYDRRVCSTRATTVGTDAFQRILLESTNETSPKARRSILMGSFSHSVIEATAYGRGTGQCSECLRNCPIVMRARNLKVKILDPEPL